MEFIKGSRRFHETRMVENDASRLVVWASANPPGVERCLVTKKRNGWALSGTLVRRFREGPAAISYAIEVDAAWRTREVHVEQILRGEQLSVGLKADASRWYVAGKEDVRLRGCVDADLGASPVTNTIPIKRKKPKVGSRVDLVVAWVRFPGLEVEPLRQSYERTGERTYVYRSASGFKSEIEMDEFGLVRRYGKYWVSL